MNRYAKQISYKFFICLVIVASSITQLFSQTIENTYYVNQQIPAGTSATYYVPISGVPANATVSGVLAKFEYIAYNGVESYVSSRFNKGSDPGGSGGVLLVAQGNLPPGNPGTYGYVSFSNWNGQSVNTNYYFRFIVAGGSPYPPTIIRIWVKVNYNVPPPPPTLVLPSNGANTNSTPLFEWNPVSGQTNFQLLIDPNQNWVNPHKNIQQSTSSNTYQVPSGDPLSPSTYYWKLKVADAYGTSDWSVVRSFTVQAPPPPPILVLPENGVTTNSTALFQWNPVSGQTDFQLLIDPNQNWTSSLRNIQQSSSSNTYQIPLNDPLPDDTYYWKLKVADAFGTSDWSAVWSFTVQSINLILISPTENENINTEQITLVWSDVGALNYDVIVDNNSGLGSREVFEENFIGTSYNIPGYFLSANTYYWKVIANFSGGSTESNVSYFNYDPPKLSEPYWTPLYRLYKPEDKDHFYCTIEEQRQVASDAGYVEERIEGSISAKPFNDPDMNNIFRLYSNYQKAHYYTTDGNDKDIKIQNGYTYEGIMGFAYSTLAPELVPMYQLHKDFGGTPSNIDYFYTISWAERQNAETNLGYTYDGIMTYVSPNSGNLSQPLALGQVLAALGVNTQNGNFRSPAIRSFNIPGKGIPLKFEHFYNSLSAVLYNERTPLSPGWTHTYNAYVYVFDPNGATTLINVVWPDGNIHEYYKDVTTYTCLTPGVYDEFEVINFPLNFKITKKDQTVYEFKTPTGARWGSPATLLTIKDRNSNTITCQYAAISPDIVNLTKVIGTSGRELNFAYYSTSGKEQLIQSISDPIGRSIQFEYDPFGNLSKFTDAENNITQYEYTSQWEQDRLLTKIILPRGNYIENVYDTTNIGGSNLKVVQNQTLSSSLSPFQIVFNPETKIATVTDPKGQIWEYTRGANELVISIINTSLGTGVSFERLDSNNPTLPTKITDGEGNVTYFIYDIMGNAQQIDQPEGIQHQFEYDAMNNITKYINPRNIDFNYGYNAYGNLTSVQDPRGTTTLSYYLPEGLVKQATNPLGHNTSFAYNGYGNVSAVTDPLSNTTQYGYDGVGRLTSVINPKSQTTTYSYDKNDNLKTVTDAIGQTVYGYDVNQNLTSILNAIGQQTTLFYDPAKDWLTQIQNNAGNNTDYSYFENGLLQTKIDPNTDNTNYTYDLAGRLRTILSPSITATMIYDNNGNLTGLTETNTGNMYFNYDRVNRLKDYEDFFGKKIYYTYDAAGNVTDVLYPGNKNVHYTYDNDNRLYSVTDWNNKITTYSYRADGSLQQVNYSNGTVSTYSYDNDERVTGMTITGPGGTIAEYTFTLDELGNHTQESINQPLSPVPNLSAESISYSYDLVNRIQSAGNVTYGFDANGNMTSRIEGGNTTNFSFNTENKLTNINGNEVTFTYDVFGNRRAAVRNGVTTRYVLDINGAMSQVLMETDVNGNPLNYYIYGLGLIARINSDGTTTRYYHGDFRGSLVAMTDANGNITHKYAYESFGKLINKVEEDPNPFQYVGTYGVMNENNGLYFMRVRYYDPEIGRFLSEDPVWNVNLYSYANNNPNYFADPSGEEGQILFSKSGISSVFSNSTGGSYNINNLLDYSKAGIKMSSRIVGDLIAEFLIKKIEGGEYEDAPFFISFIPGSFARSAGLETEEEIRLINLYRYRLPVNIQVKHIPINKDR